VLGLAQATLRWVIEAQMAQAQLACGFRWSGAEAPVQEWARRVREQQRWWVPRRVKQGRQGPELLGRGGRAGIRKAVAKVP